MKVLGSRLHAVFTLQLSTLACFFCTILHHLNNSILGQQRRTTPQCIFSATPDLAFTSKPPRSALSCTPVPDRSRTQEYKITGLYPVSASAPTTPSPYSSFSHTSTASVPIPKSSSKCVSSASSPSSHWR
jgi:hypothetical protein